MRPELIAQNWALFAEGVWITLHLTALALAAGFAIALPASLALLRGGPWLRRPVAAYVVVFRGSPLLVQLYLVYYGLSQFEVVRDSALWPVLREAWWCALITFALNSGAYMAEILRGTMATAPAGEVEAARALGLRPGQVDRAVLIPASLRRALPQLGNEAVFMLHGSAVASVITIQDILGAGRTLNALYYVAYEGFVTAAVLYLALTGVIVLLTRLAERRYLRHLGLRPAGRAAGPIMR